MTKQLDANKLTDEERNAFVKALLDNEDIKPDIIRTVRKKYLALRDAGFYHTAEVLNGVLVKFEEDGKRR
jgi:hypothetical protein